jgi:hypothetical protein
MALGEACGIAAHLAITKKVPLRRVPVAELQSLLVERKGVITFYEDLPFTDPAFAAFQFLGARGLNPGYKALKGTKLTQAEANERQARIAKYHGKPAKLANPPQDLTALATDLYKALKP